MTGMPVALPYVPTPHRSGTEVPSTQYDPRGHASGTIVAATPQNSPVGHNAQSSSDPAPAEAR